MPKLHRFHVILGILCGWMLLHSASLLSGCSDPSKPDGSAGDGGTHTDAAAAVSCMLTAPTACPFPVPRYQDVQPIFEQRCVTCHSGKTGQWPLSTYQDVADWYDTVRDDVLSCAMPPPDSGSLITVEERMAILTWIRCGFPR